ncbi:MAG: nidogen-like domain-containing protein [Gaiellaceae bacterium]
MCTSGRRLFARRIVLASLAVLLALAGASTWTGKAAAADCGCTTTGPFKSPESAGLRLTSSRYTVQESITGNLINLTIRRGSTTVYSASGLPLTTKYGFSPDDDRLVVFYTSGNLGSLLTVTLYDISGSSSRQVWTTAVTTQNARLRFSPHGKYFLFAHLVTPSMTTLDVVDADATSSALVHESSFSFAIPPGDVDASFGTNVWGFSPDSDDRTFVYAYTSGQGSVMWNVVNLATRLLVKSQNLFQISGFWQFSPCGDVIALVQQTSVSFLDVSAYKTSTGSPVGSVSGVPFGAASLATNSTHHVLTVNGNAQNLAPNSAGASCVGTPPAPVLVSVSATPNPVTGGNASTGKVVISSAAPSGGLTYTLQSLSTSVATVPPTVTIAQGATSATFAIATLAVTSTQSSTIKSTRGSESKQTTLTVNAGSSGGGGGGTAPPRPVAFVTASPTSVVGGTGSTGTVNLTGLNGTTTVTLSSSNPAVASVSGSMLVPSGSVSGTFTIATTGVAAPVNVTITASSAGASASVIVSVTPTPVSGASAVVDDPGCRAVDLPRNDDGSSAAVPLPFAANFYGRTYTFLYVNNNGNVTFDRQLPTYTPFRITASTPPIIAPFLADIDTRAAGSDLVRYSAGAITFNGRPAFCVDWVNVGYYNFHSDKLNSFQLILVDRSDVNQGDFDIVFNYDTIRWETGDASGGSNGFGGVPAGAGFSSGTGIPAQFFEVVGSLTAGALLDTNASTGLTRTSRNSTTLGRHVFDVRNGAAPAGGILTGLVTDNATPAAPLGNAPVQIARASDGTVVYSTLTNALGRFTASGLADGDYVVTAYPPAASSLQRGSAGPVHVTANTTTTQDVALRGPTPPPAGTTLSPSTTGGGGIPTVYYGNALTLTTTGCPGGTATFTVVRGGTTIASGSLSEGPPGTYTGTIPPLRPNTGYATVSISIDCPGATPDETVVFDVYIDPSGLVRDLAGNPIEDAVVTLYRADSAAGPFVAVPDGNFTMSPSNRSNPMLSDATGHFGWDVIAGYYKVRAEKEGCTSAAGAPYVETGVLVVPPPVTDLDLRLTCGAAGLSDSTAPVTTAGIAPAANGNGWRNEPISIHLSAADEAGGSGVAGIAYSMTGDSSGTDVVDGDHANITLVDEGVTHLTYFAVDRAGNVEDARTLDLKLDMTAPAIVFGTPAPAPNLAGWSRGDVTFAFTTQDVVSGVDSTTPESPLVIAGEGRNLSAEVTVVDKAGNRATYQSPAVDIDKTAPALACSVTPQMTLWPPNHKLIPVALAVLLTDALSGPASWSLVSATSSEPDDGVGDGDTRGDIQDFRPGTPDVSGKVRAERAGGGTGRTYTFSYGGTDAAGNTAACSADAFVPHG